MKVLPEVFPGSKQEVLGLGLPSPGPNGVGAVPKGAVGRASLVRVMLRGGSVVQARRGKEQHRPPDLMQVVGSAPGLGH